MADVRELGRKVKAKYPGAYDDLDDADLGRRVKAKYPGAYDDFTDTPRNLTPTERQEFGRRPVSLDQSLDQSARMNRGRPSSAPISPDSKFGPLYESQQERSRADFARKPVLDQWKERARDAAARGGGGLSRMARQTVGAGLGVARGINSGDFTPVDLPAWRQAEEGRLRYLEGRRQERPSSFATDVVEGTIEALPTAAIATLGGIATGGSLPAAVAIGGGMGAAGADWQDPRRAAVQTAIGAAAPFGGKAVGALAGRMGTPAARVAGEVVGGGASNVAGSAIEQAIFEGRLNPRALAQSAIVGGALSAPGAVAAGRRVLPRSRPTSPTRVLDTQEMPAIQGPGRPTAQLPRVNQHDVETAPTSELPGASLPLLSQVNNPGGGVPPRSESLSGRFGALARQQEAERAAATSPSRRPAPPPAPRRPGGRVGTPGPRRISETGALEDLGDFFGQMKAEEAPIVPRPRTERLPVQAATDENIGALRDRREQLSRLEATRRGEFPVDLRDEMNQLGAVIRDYENARAPREFAPPESGQPERPMSRSERLARREALQPKTGPMPETLTPGRRVSQEFQVPGGVRPAEAFKSREDARQSHFEQFDDNELMAEIRRMEDVRSQGVGGKLTREQAEANDYDLKIATEMQKERRRQQEAIGVDPANRIPVRSPGRPPRKIQHSTLGEVTEAADQSGVPAGKIRVVGETGKISEIQNPRTRGNRSAAFVKEEEAAKVEPRSEKQFIWQQTRAEVAADMKEAASITNYASVKGRKVRMQGRLEFHRESVERALREGKPVPPEVLADYPDLQPKAAMPELRGRGQIISSGFGALQGLFERGAKPKMPEPGQQELFEAAPKRSLARRAASNVVSAATLPRALMASADLSAPLRQGAILTLPPTQWGRAAKSGVRMIQALRTSKYKQLADELNNHADAKVGKDAGLYMATDPKKGSSLQGREEDFISKWAEKIPIVKHSEQAYKTYLDSIRLETFRKYKKVIDGDKNLSLEQKHAAYKAAADWINVASGRGSLGKTIDKAMPALSAVFFAPRYTASRIQVLNPATYLKNSTTPAGRAVLKQQMSDLVQFAGMVSATLAIAKAAGAEVGTDPEDSDFLKIKFGNVRYDNLAGLQQIMRLFYRTGKDVGRAAVGKKSEEGEGAIDIAGRFVRSKLAPVPSFFTDALAREDFIGREFSAGRGVAERVFPLMWKDFLDAYQREGLGGVAKLTPGVLGVGVQDFAKKPGVLTQRNEAYTSELRRLGVTPAESARRLKDEPANLYKDRTDKIQSWRDQYGGQLIQNPAYQRLNDEQRKAAIESLHGRISEQANQRNPNFRQFNPAAIVRGVREGERDRRRTDRRKIYVAPQ